MGALTDIMTRYYDILRTKVGTPVSGISNITVGTTPILIHCDRYYPRQFDLSRLPLLVAVFNEGTPSVQYGRDGDSYELSSGQNITVYAFLNNMLSGADGTGETLAIAEPLVDAILQCFAARTRLQLALDSDKSPYLTKDIRLLPHSGLTVNSKDIGVITFPFIVEYETEITRI